MSLSGFEYNKRLYVLLINPYDLHTLTPVGLFTSSMENTRYLKLVV